MKILQFVLYVCICVPKGSKRVRKETRGCGEFVWNTLRNKWVEQLLFPDMGEMWVIYYETEAGRITQNGLLHSGD